MVLVDTSVWIHADKRPESAEARELDALLQQDQVATTDLVIAEVLQGSSSASHFQENADKMEALHYFHAARETWLKAAELSFQLMRSGLTTPLSDLVVATVAMEAGLIVYTTDQHFSRVPGLHSHQSSLTAASGSEPGQTNE